MAYARTGHAQFQYEFMGYTNIYTYDFDQTQYAYCMLYEYKDVYDTPNCLVYSLCARQLNEGGDQTYKQNWQQINALTGRIEIDQTTRESFNISGGTYNWDSKPLGDNRKDYTHVLFSTTLPIFHSIDDVNHYMKTGDTSKADKDVKTNWDLYIDGTKNPLYKLTWDCADIKSSDTSKVKVLFCASDNMINDTYIVKDTHYYEYNDKSVKLNYHDIRDAVWGDAGGGVKSPVTIIVQFEYFDTTTVIPKDTSSYMYCELYPNEKDGHMYGDIGFCKVGEHST